MKGYRNATREDIGKDCFFSCTLITPTESHLFSGVLGDVYYNDNDACTYYDSQSNIEYMRCFIKDEPPKKIELDPMLEDFKPSTENLDHMILTREIELNLLKRMRGD